MDHFKEFQGKDLDECIKEACAYFNSPREKLEVELIQDAKTGVFGIIGARKAKIRARRARLHETVMGILGNDSPAPEQRKRKQNSEHIKNRIEQPAAQESARPSGPKPEQSASASQPVEADSDGFAAVPFDNLDKETLGRLSIEAVSNILKPIAGRDIEASVDLNHGRVRIKVDWEGDAGLLIGREGQTLGSVEYLLARILSRAMNAPVRVQLEIGDYKSRQDDKLREIALSLAEKARKTGRSWSTHPLSSYHRRIIHMALQDEAGIATRSSGDGPLKRVIIMPKKAGEA